ncbi:MAG: yrrB 5 [Bacteroidota bacterium]|jgi:serine phosphatase RsbU (regulator of sigma subunit)|nr:yrrB 5 [Bacteroidota bacterium]
MHQRLNFSLKFQKDNLIIRLLVVFILCLSFSLNAQDQHEIDSLEKLLPTVKTDSSRIQVLNELAAQIVDVNPARSMQLAEEALRLAEASQNKKASATSLNNIGNGHYNLADYKMALFYYIKALHIQEEIGNKKGILSASGSIGNVFLDMKQPDQALPFFEQALSISRELNNKRGIASCLIAMGTVYSDKGNYKSSLDYTSRALKLFDELDYKEAVATCYNNIADSYHKMKDFPKAMVNITKAYEIYEEIGNVYGMSLALNNLGDFYASSGQPEKALEYYKRGNEYSRQIKAGDRILSSLKGMSAAYKKLGDYKSALSMYEEFQELNDSVYNIESSKQIAEMQARFDTEKKAKEIDLLTKDKKIKESELTRQRLISWSVAIGGVFVLLLALLAIRANIQKRTANRLLEEKNQKIETAYNIIEDQHKDIKDSIKYAERLQNAILPTAAFNKHFGSNGFVLYKPKDIVSGDFYWVESVREGSIEKILFAAVDCTGHGVPGAFMSIVGHNLLKQAVKEHHKTKPSDILNELNSGLSETLRQKEEESVVKDGMDVALCSLYKNDDGSTILEYAGAFNSLWIIRSGHEKIEEIKGDKFPVGIFIGEKLREFSNHQMELYPGDSIYIFTDGYADQFGGAKGKKFKYKPLQDLLLSSQNKSMLEQKRLLEETIEKWRGNLEQVDDILVIGVKIS